MRCRVNARVRRLVRVAALPAILALASAIDGFGLGRLSLWYDEVVTMRLARAESPAALLRLLGEIDATRAPLHPLLLQDWLYLFGTSEFAGRSFSVVCGVATVFLIYRIGLATFGASTGLWAAWLATLSPLLIYYAREARMYAWLVFVTCACWALLFQLRNTSRRKTPVAYGIALVALGYSHPLGLIMLATLAMASGFFATAFFGSRIRWFGIHAMAGLLIAPWLNHYLDHAPESFSGPLPIKFLLGTPIGFIGGNFVTLAGLLTVAGYGVVRDFRERQAEGNGQSSAHVFLTPTCLLIWLAIPPLVLFAYSWISHPIFGPARYTLFVAPAYLILVASGLSRLPAVVRFPLAVGMAGLSVMTIMPMVFDPEIKGDWRAFAASVEHDRAELKAGPSTVLVMSADAHNNVEVETARYYLPADCTILKAENIQPEKIDRASPVFLAVGSRRGQPVRTVPDRVGDYHFLEDRSFPGLAIFRGEIGP